MKQIAFCVPSTCNKRDWKSAEETYLYQILFNEIEKFTPNECEITCYVGYDNDDKIWSSVDERMKCNATFMNFKIEWIEFDSSKVKGKPTWIWNGLAEQAIKDGFEYLKLLGDDIRLPRDRGWLGAFVNKLKKNRNIGWVAGYSNNDQIPTQFLVHKNHIDIFGWAYPPEIPNWTCDDFLYQVYPDKWRIWLKSFPLYNVGGEPRYEVEFNPKFLQAILRRYRPRLNRFLQQIDK